MNEYRTSRSFCFRVFQGRNLLLENLIHPFLFSCFQTSFQTLNVWSWTAGWSQLVNDHGCCWKATLRERLRKKFGGIQPEASQAQTSVKQKQKNFLLHLEPRICLCTCIYKHNDIKSNAHTHLCACVQTGLCMGASLPYVNVCQVQRFPWSLHQWAFIVIAASAAACQILKAAACLQQGEAGQRS